MSDIGHNSGVAGDQLRAFIERIERLNEDKQAIADDLKELMSEVKSVGYDTKIIRKIVSMRKRDANQRKEEEALTELYLHALGMI